MQRLPIIRVISMKNTMKYGDLLFDLKNDPDQNTSIMDTVVEEKMIQAMKGLLEENGRQPQELYDRIGLNMN